MTDGGLTVTHLGHAGALIESGGTSILCDPWFVPAFFGSWFPFPRNDRLAPDLRDRLEHPDYLYISHLHADHLDEAWLADHVDRSATVLLPDFPTDELEERLRSLGFASVLPTRHAEELSLPGGLTVAIHVEVAVADGPGGDSALIVSDGSTRVLNQNDCHVREPHSLLAHGPVDVHLLQFSGAIWYPMVYDLPADEMHRRCEAKREAQFHRAAAYVTAVGARVVVPSAGPPCFLDEDLFGLNMIRGDEDSIFPDQATFRRRMQDTGVDSCVLALPGTALTVDAGHVRIEHPGDDATVSEPFSDKERYLRDYQRDWSEWLVQHKASWPTARTDVVSELQSWWEPLLAGAPHLRAQVGGVCVIESGGDLILVDFPTGRVLAHDADDAAFRFEIPRPLLEQVVQARAVDWSNELFLSCRFRAWRAGDYNDALYAFFKSLSPQRMARAEAEARAAATSPAIDDETLVIGGFEVQRHCPHRSADLAEFGSIEGDHLVCALHGWRFRTSDGTCENADSVRLRIRPLSDDAPPHA